MLESEEAILSMLRAYQKAIESGGRADAQQYCLSPLAYIDEHGARLCEQYPYDPQKLRRATGFDHADLKHTIVHASESKAHVLLEGTRHRADGSVIERIDAIYVVHKLEADWKISAFSGVRTSVQSTQAPDS